MKITIRLLNKSTSRNPQVNSYFFSLFVFFSLKSLGSLTKLIYFFKQELKGRGTLLQKCKPCFVSVPLQFWVYLEFTTYHSMIGKNMTILDFCCSLGLEQSLLSFQQQWLTDSMWQFNVAVPREECFIYPTNTSNKRAFYGVKGNTTPQ